MKLSEIIEPDSISLNLKPDSSEQLLREIAALASSAEPLKNISKETIYNALSDRERLSSTACGHGVAIPHCRIPEMPGFVAGLVVLSNGIDFNASDNEKVDLIPFVIGPEEHPRTHLQLLSSLAQVFRNDKLRNSIRNAETPEIACKILSDSTYPDEDRFAPSGKKLLHLFVQDESVFDELLQVFATAETTSSMIMDADESTRYLMNIPFYAGFWNTDIQNFNRIIVSVIRNELVNATIRNIEFICGPLSERTDIMITVSDLQSVHGSLEN
jgi:PTS system nitrogen regulatory IIA component